MTNYVFDESSITNISPNVKDLSDGAPVNLFEVAVPSGASVVVRIIYNETVVNASNIQNHLGEVIMNAVNNGSAIDATINDLNEITAKTAGTLTDTWAATVGTNKVTVSVNANTSLGTLTSFYIRYGIRSMTNPQITFL